MKTHELFLLLVLLFYLNAKALSKSVETSTPIFRELPIYSSDFVQDSFDKTSKTELDPDGNSVDGLPKYWQARLGDICQLPSFPRATGDPTKYLECVKQGLSEDRADLGLWTLRECVQGFEFVAAARRCKSIRLINRQQLMCSSSRAADYDFCPSGTGDEFEIHETRQTPRRCSCPNGADDCLCPRPEILEPVKVARRTRTTEIVIDHTPAMRFQSFQTNSLIKTPVKLLMDRMEMETRVNLTMEGRMETDIKTIAILGLQMIRMATTQNGFNNQMPSSNNQNGFTGSSQNFNGQTTQNGFTGSSQNFNGQTTQNGFSNQQQSTNQNNGFTGNSAEWIQWTNNPERIQQSDAIKCRQATTKTTSTIQIVIQIIPANNKTPATTFSQIIKMEINAQCPTSISNNMVQIDINRTTTTGSKVQIQTTPISKTISKMTGNLDLQIILHRIDRTQMAANPHRLEILTQMMTIINKTMTDELIRLTILITQTTMIVFHVQILNQIMTKIMDARIKTRIETVSKTTTETRIEMVSEQLNGIKTRMEMESKLESKRSRSKTRIEILTQMMIDKLITLMTVFRVQSTRNGNTRQNGRQSTASNNLNDDNYQQNNNCVPCRSNNQQNGRQKGNRQFGPTNYPSSNRQNSQNFPQLSPTLMNMKKLMDIQIEIEQLKMQKNQLVRDEFQSNNGRGGSKNNGAGNVAGSSRNGETSKNRDGAYQQQSGNCQMLTTQQQYCPRRDQQAVIQPQPCALVQGSATNARYQGICSWMLDPLASDPESRCHFLQCQPAANNLFCGRWQRMPCAPATVFDAAAQVCVWDTLGQPGPLPLPTPAPPTSAPKIATMQNSGMQLLNSHCNNGPNANLCRGGVQIGSCNSNFQCPGQSVCQIGEIMTLGLMPCTACCYYKSMMHAE
ncbi:CRE-PQN-74 protein [Aphelenchoides bicaudatus]|nr:CRE-PQN-74 protein [Aphelenchoides bicaudatus]